MPRRRILFVNRDGHRTLSRRFLKQPGRTGYFERATTGDGVLSDRGSHQPPGCFAASFGLIVSWFIWDDPAPAQRPANTSFATSAAVIAAGQPA